VTETRTGEPLYYGMFKHADAKAGYAIWLPMFYQTMMTFEL
jgi:hypothetical protein